MKNIIRYIVSITLVFTFFHASLPRVPACGPYTLDPIFSLKKHADYPLSEFAGGKVGIVPATYKRMNLFVFYRYLNNLSPTKEEQKQIVDALEHRVGHTDYDSSYQENPPDYFARWRDARAKVAGGAAKVSTEKLVPGGYNYFSNCLAGAFDNATKTLEARISKYGADANVKEWVKGQDAVFANCDYAAGAPETLGANFPEWLRKDREYQIAASLFYMTDFASARENFEKIATDENSVWKNTAKFVIARSYIRQASFIEISDENPTAAQTKSELLQKASAQLENILNDNSITEFHPSAHRLMGLVKYRSVPEERQKELADILARNAENQNLYNDLIDYTWLLEYTESEAIGNAEEALRKQAIDAGKAFEFEYELKLGYLSAADREKDLTDWLFTYQAEDGFAHAFEKWKETGKLQWLVAAAVHTDVSDEQTAEILNEIDKIKPASPAFATVRYHQIRLLLKTGNRTEAKKKLDEVFAGNLKNFPVSTQNRFLAQRMSIAENLDEFLKFAPRKASIFTWSDDGAEDGTSLKDEKYLSAWENRVMFDTDSVAFFNEKMPLSVLRQAALSPQVPEHLKKFLVTAVWTRAFMFGNQAVEREFTPLMQRYAKEYSPLFSKYANASSAANREAAALTVILRYPVIQPYVPVGFGREDSTPATIDSTRGNWWCAEEQSVEDKGFYDEYPFVYPEVYPDFLSAEQKSSAEREHKQMMSLGGSSTFLARRAVEFAKQNPNHAQTPEILHLAVRSTRYGCGDDQTGLYSREAFQILHKRYPNSAWTKKTPFWFGSLPGDSENQ